MSRRRRAVMIPLLAGVALGASGCSGKDIVTENPPPPPPEPELSENPPPPDIPEAPGPPGSPEVGPTDGGEQAALPEWDAVASGHPEGATNPPMPVLYVSEDGSRCWKGWSDPRAMDREVMLNGGKVISDPADADGATEVACPDKASAVLEKVKGAEDAGQ